MLALQLSENEEEGKEPVTTFLVFLYILLSLLLLSLELTHIFYSSINFNLWINSDGMFNHMSLQPVLSTSFQVTQWYDEPEMFSIDNNEDMEQSTNSCDTMRTKTRFSPQVEQADEDVGVRETETRVFQKSMMSHSRAADLKPDDRLKFSSKITESFEPRSKKNSVQKDEDTPSKLIDYYSNSSSNCHQCLMSQDNICHSRCTITNQIYISR